MGKQVSRGRQQQVLRLGGESLPGTLEASEEGEWPGQRRGEGKGEEREGSGRKERPGL